MSKAKIKIGVISDVVCPWCYIGKRRLEKAMANVSDKFDFEVEYFPFELNPQIPAAGFDQKEYLSKKFGGESRYEEMTGHVSRVAAQEGLTFDFAAQQVSPNTRKAHRIIQLAREDGRHLQVVEGFFKAHFSDGMDLSKDENLVKVAAQAGMDEAKVSEFLRTDTGTAEVEIAERELQQLGITGVPFYVIDNKYGISGAQRPESFIQVFEETQQAAAAAGEMCDPDTKNC